MSQFEPSSVREHIFPAHSAGVAANSPDSRRSSWSRVACAKLARPVQSAAGTGGSTAHLLSARDYLASSIGQLVESRCHVVVIPFVVA